MINELAEFCRDLKSDFTPKITDAKKPVRFWSEKDVYNGNIVDAFVIIFRTHGCSWALKSGCTMCGYFNDSMWKKVSDEDIFFQFEKAIKQYNNEKTVKIFTSGSFLDDSEVKPKVRMKILSRLSESAEKISFESRPEYVTNQKLKEIKNIDKSKDFEIGIGLETANDTVRNYAINKGITFNDYKKAAEIIKKNNCKLKTYVLIKPPFLTEKETIKDCIETVDKIKKHTDTISFNPANVQRKTLVEFLWKKNQYRPAWLWSVIEILNKSKKNTDKIRLQCNIAGGGNIRGAHNCKECDPNVLRAIESFSLHQDPKIFKDLDCECKEKWLDQLDIEDLGFGSIIDLSR